MAYNTVVTQRPTEAGTLIAFSTGSLLSLALGKFSRFDETAVQWLAAVGASYGAIAVRADSPYRSLSDLVAALKANPAPVVIGLSGAIGSQDKTGYRPHSWPKPLGLIPISCTTWLWRVAEPPPQPCSVAIFR